MSPSPLFMKTVNKILIGIGSGLAGVGILVGVLFGMSKCSGDKPSSSSDSSSSIPTSSESSSSSSSIEPISSSEHPEHEHDLGDWQCDEVNHWHECSICHEIFNLDEHNFEEVERHKDLDDFTKIDIVSICTICDSERTDQIDATNEQLCDFMNEDLNLHSEPFSDVFGPKDYLQDLGYPVSEDLDDDNHFGYVEETKKMVIVDGDNQIKYPQSEKEHEVIVYKEEGVINDTTLKEALSNISSTSSIIKVANDFTLYNSVVIDIDDPVEIDLNGKTLSVKDGSIYSALTIKDDDAVVTIKNGTIKTAVSSEYSVGSACIASLNCKSLRVSNCNLISQAERGYGYIDDVNTSDDYSVVIEDSVITSPICSVCIQKSNCKIINSTLNGAVSIIGGSTLIDNCIINPSSDEVDISEGFVTSQYLSETLEAALVDNVETFDRKIFTSTDAITILDRRSINGTYGEISLTIKNSTLNSYTISNEVYGYGLRYIDLGFDTSISPSKDNIKIDNCIFPSCKDNDPKEKVGGYSFYTYSK